MSQVYIQLLPDVNPVTNIFPEIRLMILPYQNVTVYIQAMKSSLKYASVVATLKERIRSGVYAPGTRLPGHQALAREFGVSSITSNRALAELSTCGWVERRERSGTFVCSRPIRMSEVVLLMHSDPATVEPMQADYFRGLVSRAETEGLSVRVARPTSANLVRILEESPPCAGLITIMCSLPFEAVLPDSGERVPHVCLGLEDPDSRYCATEDRRRACRQLGQMMLADGAERILFVGNLIARNHALALAGLGDALEGGHSPMVLDVSATDPARAVENFLGVHAEVDSVVVMGGRLPMSVLPCLLSAGRHPRLGFMTENSGIVQFSQIAFLAQYSQLETGRLALELLQDVSSGAVCHRTTRYSEFRITRPGEMIP